ncbi:LacI family DNA-binding transcriptional regulator [Bradyrhizobium sp.]|uniref:LacI family DNA-binding transcriptional regulator n=1 Tax=Bradyrhizobium sp. TaxID=376 RepID=UPI0039E5D77C
MARLAGVSISTVSRALRQPDIVSPDVRGRIDEAVARLSYRRNVVAGALASARSMTVGVIIPSIINSFFAATIEALEQGMAGSGYQLLLGNTGYSAEAERQLVSSFLAWSPAAMVLTGRRHHSETVGALLSSQIPVLEMWELSDHPIDMIVGFSHRAVGQLVFQHLARRGAERLGFIGAYMDRDYRTADRRAGFAEAALQAGYDAPIEVHLPERASAMGGATGLRELMARSPGVDAVFCSNDMIALGALFEAGRRGLSVPGDLKICGFGDLEFAAACDPPLTTVRPPGREIGLQIATLLRGRLEGTIDGGGSFDLGAELVSREST